MSTLEEVLGAHQLTHSFTTVNGFKPALCGCGEQFHGGWMRGWEWESQQHRAHLAAVIRAWASSDEVVERGAVAILRDMGDPEDYAPVWMDSARAALAAAFASTTAGRPLSAPVGDYSAAVDPSPTDDTNGAQNGAEGSEETR